MQAHRNAETARTGRRPARVGGFDGYDVGQVVQEADHRIANHLALLAGFVRLKASDLARKSSDPSGEDVQLALGAISSQIVAVARLHRSLTRDGSAPTDLGLHLHDVSASLSVLCGNVEIIEDFADGCLVQPDQILPLTQIVSEVLVNAVKYARPADARTMIMARCSREDDGGIRVEIADNGRGLPDTFDPKLDDGLGFRLLRAFARQLQAHIEFESSRAGLCFRLTLPPPTPGANAETASDGDGRQTATAGGGPRRREPTRP